MSLYQLQLNIESDSINHVSNLGKCICALICSSENVLVKSYGAKKIEPNSENIEPKTQTASLKQHTQPSILLDDIKSLVDSVYGFDECYEEFVEKLDAFAKQQADA